MIKTRFAPSPTGDLHIGSLRTALYSYALAKSKKGNFILRIEDTDKKREIPGAIEGLKNDLRIFQLNWDEFYIQSERVKLGVYQKAADKLVSDGHAFYCQCSPKNAKKQGFSKELRDPCRDKNLSSGAVKLRVPENETVFFTDYVLRKKISWNSSEVADATLLKSDGFPTYHLAVVVDDSQMGVTHALRGHDWMPSTPIHILVYQYLGLKMPKLGHLTDILDPEGKGKLSKRRGSVSVEAFLKEGYLPEALLNFVMLLGWAPKDNEEILALEEFVKRFSQDGLQKSNPIFNRDKLLWFNSQYIQKAEDEFLAKEIHAFTDKKYDLSLIQKITPLIKTRIKLLAEFETIAGFLFTRPTTLKELEAPEHQAHLRVAQQALTDLENWELDGINRVLMRAIEKNGFKVGKFFMSLRLAIASQKITPPINDSLVILGKKETLARINKLI